MKKLLLILSAVLVSVTSVFAGLNPYAYNLSSSWDEANSQLTVRFKLNAHPNMTVNNSGRGIQILAIDPSNNNKQYYIYGVPGTLINEKIAANSLDYELTIPITGKTWDNKDFLPVGRNLTWAVKVAGLNKTDKGTPTEPVYVNQARRPYSCHGVAVNNNQNSPDFGSIYVTEAAKDDELSGTWAWLQGKGKALLKYDPRMQDATSYRKSTPFSDRNLTKNLLEPHRVCVSEDGRVFVSSYNKCKTKDEPVVWEFKNGQFTPVIYYYPADGTYGDRVCGMAVKGSGDDLRIMLCYIDEPKAHPSAFRMYEYDLNNLGTNKNEGNWRGSYAPEGNTTDGSTASVQGAFTKAIQNNWYFYSDGLANVSYLGNGHVLAVDFFVGYGANAVLRYYEGTNKKSENAITRADKQGYYYGGAGLLAYQDDDGKYIVSGRTYYYGYESNPNTNETNGRIHTYTLSNTTISSSPKSGWSLTGVKTRSIINAMAMDCAKNIYAVSFTDGTENVGTGQLLAFAMPYSGETTTIAPSSNAATNRYFKIKPIPNILATDLHYEPHKSLDRYIFSFNVNTKPTYAEVRFYDTKDARDNSINVVNTDYYRKNASSDPKPKYKYIIPANKLKAGEIKFELGMVGGKVDVNGIIVENAETFPCIPRGELYWTVYVETHENDGYGPIYRLPGTSVATSAKDKKGNTIFNHERRYATVNNWPESDYFGSIVVAHNPSYVTNDTSRPERGLRFYGINPEGNWDDSQDMSDNATRYCLKKEYLNSSMTSGMLNMPRRLEVGPDGKIYIADKGTVTNFVDDPENAKYNYWRDYSKGSAMHTNGGVKVWDPKSPNKLSLFSDNALFHSSDVALYKRGDQWKLLAMNTYDEYYLHANAKTNYTEDHQESLGVYGWNGFVEYVMDKYTSTHNGSWASWGSGYGTDAKLYSLRRGDASGDMSIVAIDKGVWICQHREHNVDIKRAMKETLADNLDAYVLSFVPYGSYGNQNNNKQNESPHQPRSWRSCTTHGVYFNKEVNPIKETEYTPKSELTQKETSLLQSTPGAGMAYRRVYKSASQYDEYLYVVNHDGDIVVLKIEWDEKDTNKPLVYVSKATVLQTHSKSKGNRTVTNSYATKTWKTSFITSISFDYAGNMVTTAGLGNTDKPHDIVVYTLPYERDNAREIQASLSCELIPERLAQFKMTNEDIQAILTEHAEHEEKCYIDLYRPMQGGMFNTFCVPFQLITTDIPQGHPLYNSEIKRFVGVTLNDDLSGEKILTLNFDDLEENIMAANVPHIIKPTANIKSIVQFDWVLTLAKDTIVKPHREEFDGGNSITYQGILPKTEVKALYDPTTNLPLRLILVADNRLAVLTGNGEMYGFRGYFDLAQPLPPGTVAKISAKKDTPTNTTIVVDGKKVNIEKYLREGRVYIRVGDSLYTVDGQLVK